MRPTQTAQASTRTLAAPYGLNPKTIAKWRLHPKTVAKWRLRQTTADAPLGPRQPRRAHGAAPASQHRPDRGGGGSGAVLRTIVEFRRRTLPPLDDVMGGLRETIPKLSRSALHRGLERPGISRLPRDQENTAKRQRFAATTLGDVPIDRCDLRRAEGKLFLVLASDRVSRFTHVAFLDAATRMHGAALLRDVVATFPDALHTGLTDTGMAFADLPQDRDGPTATWMGPIFGRVCREQGIEPKLTRPSHPGTNGQTEVPPTALD